MKERLSLLHHIEVTYPLTPSAWRSPTTWQRYCSALEEMAVDGEPTKRIRNSEALLLLFRLIERPETIIELRQQIIISLEVRSMLL